MTLSKVGYKQNAGARKILLRQYIKNNGRIDLFGEMLNHVHDRFSKVLRYYQQSFCQPAAHIFFIFYIVCVLYDIQGTECIDHDG